MPEQSDLELHFEVGRRITVGWRGSRAQSAEDIASRLKAMVERLTDLGIVRTPLWPLIDRPPRPNDPTVSSLSIADLARLIDRRARFDPPQLPQPVGPEGYLLAAGSNQSPRHADHVSIWIRAGSTHAGYENSVALDLHGRHPIWGDTPRCLEVLRLLIEIWNAEWGAITSAGQWDEHGDRQPHSSVPTTKRHDWIYWAAPGAARMWRGGVWRPGDDADVTEPWLNGRLWIWSSEAVLDLDAG